MRKIILLLALLGLVALSPCFAEEKFYEIVENPGREWFNTEKEWRASEEKYKQDEETRAEEEIKAFELRLRIRAVEASEGILRELKRIR